MPNVVSPAFSLTSEAFMASANFTNWLLATLYVTVTKASSDNLKEARVWEEMKAEYVSVRPDTVILLSMVVRSMVDIVLMVRLLIITPFTIMEKYTAQTLFLLQKALYLFTVPQTFTTLMRNRAEEPPIDGAT